MDTEWFTNYINERAFFKVEVSEKMFRALEMLGVECVPSVHNATNGSPYAVFYVHNIYHNIVRGFLIYHGIEHKVCSRGKITKSSVPKGAIIRDLIETNDPTVLQVIIEDFDNWVAKVDPTFLVLIKSVMKDNTSYNIVAKKYVEHIRKNGGDVIAFIAENCPELLTDEINNVLGTKFENVSINDKLFELIGEQLKK